MQGILSKLRALLVEIMNAGRSLRALDSWGDSFIWVELKVRSLASETYCPLGFYEGLRYLEKKTSESIIQIN